MPAAPIPINEAERLSALAELDLLDTPPEPWFDEITRLAAHICDVPIAAISIVDQHRQWFKARVGLDDSQTGRDVSFCAYAILQDEVLEVTNAPKDKRFADNALVTDGIKIQFYAGANIRVNDQNLGALCVIDKRPRRLATAQKQGLQLLANHAAAMIEMRSKLVDMRKQVLGLGRLMDEADHYQIVMDGRGFIVSATGNNTELAKLAKNGVFAKDPKPGVPLQACLHLEQRPMVDAALWACRDGKTFSQEILAARHPAGRWFEFTFAPVTQPVLGGDFQVSLRITDVEESKRALMEASSATHQASSAESEAAWLAGKLGAVHDLASQMRVDEMSAYNQELYAQLFTHLDMPVELARV